jgi:DNA-binding XRE family transcriptional regulator
MNSNLSEKTSKRLYELRTNAGYTMEKLASMLNVSKGTISKWEKGSIKNMRQDKCSTYRKKMPLTTLCKRHYFFAIQRMTMHEITLFFHAILP